MTKLALLLPLLLLVSPAGAKGRKQKAPKPPDVAVISMIARRSPEGIEFDGKIRNTGVKPVQEMRLIFDFFADEKVPLTTQSAEIDEEVLEPGQESTIRFAVRDIPRAVAIRLNAVDRNKRELGLANAGPFPIE